jgi:hypothetical protein
MVLANCSSPGQPGNERLSIATIARRGDSSQETDQTDPCWGRRPSPGHDWWGPGDNDPKPLGRSPLHQPQGRRNVRRGWLGHAMRHWFWTDRRPGHPIRKRGVPITIGFSDLLLVACLRAAAADALFGEQLADRLFDACLGTQTGCALGTEWRILPNRHGLYFKTRASRAAGPAPDGTCGTPRPPACRPLVRGRRRFGSRARCLVRRPAGTRPRFPGAAPAPSLLSCSRCDRRPARPACPRRPRPLFQEGAAPPQAGRARPACAGRATETSPGFVTQCG